MKSGSYTEKGVTYFIPQGSYEYKGKLISEEEKKKMEKQLVEQAKTNSYAIIDFEIDPSNIDFNYKIEKIKGQNVLIRLPENVNPANVTLLKDDFPTRRYGAVNIDNETYFIYDMSRLGSYQAQQDRKETIKMILSDNQRTISDVAKLRPDLVPYFSEAQLKQLQQETQKAQELQTKTFIKEAKPSTVKVTTEVQQKPPLFTPADPTKTYGNYVYTTQGWVNVKEEQNKIDQEKAKLQQLKNQLQSLPKNTVLSYDENTAQQINIRSRYSVGIDLADAYALGNIDKNKFYELGQKLGFTEAQLKSFENSIIKKDQAIQEIKNYEKELDTYKTQLTNLTNQQKPNNAQLQSIDYSTQMSRITPEDLKRLTTQQTQPKEFGIQIENRRWFNVPIFTTSAITNPNLYDIKEKFVGPKEEPKQKQSGILYAYQTPINPLNITIPATSDTTTQQIQPTKLQTPVYTVTVPSSEQLVNTYTGPVIQKPPEKVSELVTKQIQSLNPETMEYYKQKGKIEMYIPIEKIDPEERTLYAGSIDTETNRIKITIPYEKAYQIWKSQQYKQEQLGDLFTYAGWGGDFFTTKSYEITVPFTQQKVTIKNPFDVEDKGFFGTVTAFIQEPFVVSTVRSKLAPDFVEQAYQTGAGITEGTLRIYTAGIVTRAPFIVAKGIQTNIATLGLKQGTLQTAKDFAQTMTQPFIGQNLRMSLQYGKSLIPQVQKAAPIVNIIEKAERGINILAMTTAPLPDIQPIKTIQEYGRGRYEVAKEIAEIYTFRPKLQTLKDFSEGIAWNLPYYGLKSVSAKLPSTHKLPVALTDTAYLGLNIAGATAIISQELPKHPNNLARGFGRATMVGTFIEDFYESKTIDVDWERSSFYKAAQENVKKNIKQGKVDIYEYTQRLTAIDLKNKPDINIDLRILPEKPAFLKGQIAPDIASPEPKEPIKKPAKKQDLTEKQQIKLMLSRRGLSITQEQYLKAIELNIKAREEAIKQIQSIKTTKSYGYEYKPTTKPDVKLDLRSEYKLDIKEPDRIFKTPYDFKPDQRIEPKPDKRIDERPDEKIEPKQDQKPDKKEDNRKEPKIDIKQEWRLPDVKYDIHQDFKEEIKYEWKIDYPPTMIPNPFIPFFGGGGGSGGKRPTMGQLLNTKLQYKPSLTAGILSIKGIPITAEGYAIRPLIFAPTQNIENKALKNSNVKKLSQIKISIPKRFQNLPFLKPETKTVKVKPITRIPSFRNPFKKDKFKFLW